MGVVAWYAHRFSRTATLRVRSIFRRSETSHSHSHSHSHSYFHSQAIRAIQCHHPFTTQSASTLSILSILTASGSDSDRTSFKGKMVLDHLWLLVMYGVLEDSNHLI